MNDESALVLAAGDLRAAFWPGAGMLGVSLRHRGEEFLRRLGGLEEAKAKGSTAGIPLLYPWANRLASLHYQAAGHNVDLDPSSSLLHFDDHGFPMHGVPWSKLAWEILDQKQDSMQARLIWNRQELLALFPFPHSLQIAGEVTPDSLTLQTDILADAGSPVPISFGFHPYLGIPNLSREQWRLQLPQMHKLQLDPRGIPTGKQEPFGPIDAMIGETSFDDGFALISEQSSFSLSGPRHTVTVIFLEGFPFTQVFAPAGKEFIALEPMTAPTNALTSGQGLRILAPGAQYRASFRIAIYSNN